MSFGPRHCVVVPPARRKLFLQAEFRLQLERDVRVEVVNPGLHFILAGGVGLLQSEGEDGPAQLNDWRRRGFLLPQRLRFSLITQTAVGLVNSVINLRVTHSFSIRLAASKKHESSEDFAALNY